MRSILLFNSFLIFLFFTAAANNLLKVFRNYSLVSLITCLLLFAPFVFILMNLFQRPSYKLSQISLLELGRL